MTGFNLCSVGLVSSLHLFFVFFFGICSFSRFLDGRAIPQYREWSSFGNCHVGFPSVCKISFVQCKNMFWQRCVSRFLHAATMLRVLLVWRYKVDAKLSCVCVCVFVVVLFHVECCFIIVVASCEVTRHYGLVRGLNCNHPCGSAAGGNVGAVLPRCLLHRDMYLYVG